MSGSPVGPDPERVGLNWRARLGHIGRTMLAPLRELEFLKFLETLGQYLRSTRDPRKALAFALREGRAFFQADSGCIAVAEAGEPDARVVVALPRDDDWDLAHIARFIRHTRPPVRSDVVLAPIRRRGSAWGAMAFRRQSPPFDHDDGRLMARATAVVSDAIQAMDRERMLEVRDRIDRRIMELLHPKDLFYQILDGLRSLTHYDHSSALLIRERGEDTLRLVAEQIAWTKARSRHIGLTLPIDAELEPALASAEIYGFDRHGDGWQAWTGKPVARLAELLDYNRDGHDGGHAREASMLCAPLVARDGVIGLLKVASRHPGRLTPFDAELIDRFRSQAAVAIQNLHADRVAASAHADRRAEARDGRPRAHRLARREQRARRDAAAHPADAGRPPGRPDGPRRLPRGPRPGAELGAGLPPDLRRHAVVRPRRRPPQPPRRGVGRRSRRRWRCSRTACERRGIDSGRRRRSTICRRSPCGQSDLEQVFLNLLTNAREASRTAAG